MKEKRKGHPRRRLFWLFGLLVLLLGGYFSLPFAQTAFVEWWEDDPFTPRCDIPDYEIYRPAYYPQSALSALNPNAIETVFPYSGSLSPNGRWLRLDADNLGYTHIYDLSTDSSEHRYRYHSNDSEGAFYWLYDSQLLYRQTNVSTSNQSWYIHNLETQELRLLPQHVLDDSYPISHVRLSGNNYFLANEMLRGSEVSRELVLYTRDLRRLVLYSSPVSSGATLSISGQLSPNARYYTYKITTEFRDVHYNNVENVSWWLVDLEDEAVQSLRLSLDTHSEVVWSPDSTYLAYSEEGNLSFYDVQEQQIVETYTVPNHDVFIRQWDNEGFWLVEINQSSQEISLNWANFDGDRVESHFVFKGHMELIRALEGRNSYLLNLYQDEGIVIINTNGEIEARISNLDDWFPSQSPDNRYLSYFGDSNWLYLLDLETMQSCKSFETLTEQNSAYQWRIIPQS